MLLECTKPFGRWVPGDTREIPDTCLFDKVHWRRVGPNPVAPSADAYMVVEVTPEQAALLLTNRVGANLPDLQYDKRMLHYRDAMNAGKWLDTSVIDFTEGKLRDGTHRMLALSGADAPQSFHVRKEQYPDFVIAAELPEI